MENRLHSRAYDVSARALSGPNSGSVQSMSTGTTPTLAGTEMDGTVGNMTRGIVDERVPAPDVGGASAGVAMVPSQSVAKRTRKEREANWNPLEVHALIQAKWKQFIQEIDCVDGRHLTVPEATKWLRVSDDVMRVGASLCHRDGVACKSKWSQLVPEYKRIADFLNRTGTNDLAYWNMSATERKAEGLPRSFGRDIFFQIHDSYGNRPVIQPPHSRDLLSDDDSNYLTPITGSQDIDQADGSLQDEEEQLAPPSGTDDSEDFSGSTHSSGGVRRGSLQWVLLLTPLSTPPTSPVRAAKASLSPGVTPQLLSDSKATDRSGKQRPRSTGVRRKSLSGHSLIANTTRATSECMAAQLKAIADASQDIEKSKMDVQKQFFKEQLDYQRDQDRKLSENARVANYNAKLAINKQAEVVHCLAQLSIVISAGIQQRLHLDAHGTVVGLPVQGITPTCPTPSTADGVLLQSSRPPSSVDQ